MFSSPIIRASSYVRYMRLTLVSAPLIIAGCAVAPPAEHVYYFPAETERSHIGRIAVTSDQNAPQFTFDPVVTGKGKGAARGAGIAVSSLLENCPHSTGVEGGLIALVCLALTPVAAVGGSVYGGAVAPSKDDVETSREHIDKALDELDALNGLRARTTRMVELYWPAGVAELQQPVQGESDNSPDQLTSTEVAAGSILHVALSGLGVEESKGADPQLTIIIRANADLADKSGEHEFYRSKHYYRSGAYSYQQWAQNDAALLRETFSEAYQELALNIVENALLLYPLYSVNQESKTGDNQTRQLAGLEIIYPTKKGFWTNKVMVDSLQPALRWEAFPRTSDLAERNSPLLRAQDVRYELLVCQAEAEKDYKSCDKVTHINDITTPSYTFEQPLEKTSHYYWSVRAKFRLDGDARVTPWSGIKDREVTTAPVYSQFTYQFFTP